MATNSIKSNIQVTNKHIGRLLVDIITSEPKYSQEIKYSKDVKTLSSKDIKKVFG